MAFEKSLTSMSHIKHILRISKGTDIKTRADKMETIWQERLSHKSCLDFHFLEFFQVSKPSKGYGLAKHFNTLSSSPGEEISWAFRAKESFWHRIVPASPPLPAPFWRLLAVWENLQCSFQQNHADRPAGQGCEGEGRQGTGLQVTAAAAAVWAPTQDFSGG